MPFVSLHASLRRRRGVAIVIVLAFVTMLTGVLVAFLSLTVSERFVSKASADHSGVELFTLGAVEAIVGDLKQEIAAGSVSPFPTPADNVILYRPRDGQTAVPARVGASSVPGYENLVKRSVYNQPFYSGPAYDADYPASNRAAPLSTLAPSRNGRVLSPARWNMPLFLQKDDAASDTDFTPVGAIPATASSLASWNEAPDWVLVARNGTNPTQWSNNLKDSDGSASAVVGRYAYMIYDQGGLLDANVAGYPSLTDLVQARYKPLAAFADLRQLPGFADLADPEPVINALVGWRNYASSSEPGAPLSGGFPDYNWTADHARNYYQSVVFKNTGFINVANRSLVNGQSDRFFTSRQQLIAFLTQGIVETNADRARIQNALPYLTNFSRDLNQPSLFPAYGGSAPNRLPIVDVGMAGIGNSAFGNEAAYNPPFLSIRVDTPFTRMDGSSADAGEPLVKKRFALDRLAWLTCKGPIAGLNDSDPIRSFYLTEAGLSKEFLDKGTAENIYDYFGLTWSSSGAHGSWVYNHGINSGGAIVIGTLEQVRDEGREPDFFELLKASINVGSLAKSTGYTSGSEAPMLYRGTVDQRVDFQILQIGANMIDQFDPDGFPTHLRVADASNVERNFYGRENLPYLNSIHLCTVGAQAASPEGQLVLLEIPAVWNPVDANSAFPAPGNLAPAFLRATIVTSDPATTVTPTANQLQTVGQYEGSARVVTSVTWDSQDETAIVFSNAQALYREPTLLAQPGVPAGSNLALGTGYRIKTIDDRGTEQEWKTPVMEVTGGQPTELIGFVAGALPWEVSEGGEEDEEESTQKKEVLRSLSRRQSAVGRTIRLEWATSQAGPWHTYSEYYVPSPYSSVYGFTNPEKALLSNWNSDRHWAQVAYDPRTPRFGMVRGQTSLNETVKLYANNRLDTIRAKSTAGSPATDSTTHSFHSNVDSPHGTAGWGTTRDFVYPGMSQQNNPKAIFTNKNAGSGSQAYKDPDGVVRRAMAGYVATTASGPPANTTSGLPLVSPAMPGSRPIFLNRPFRNIGELGYVYRDTPWKNIDFFMAESGDGGLLDTFCIHDDESTSALVAGRVNLNTRQKPVLLAILSGIHRDELGSVAAPSSADIDRWATALIDRTTSTDAHKGPLIHLSDLVGRHTPNYQNAWDQEYDGYSSDLGALNALNMNFSVQRFREAPIRALASVGGVRTWNLMIDVVAQTGRYAPSAAALEDFNVESEQRFWVHLAIDRYTGEVIDKQIELIK